MVLRLGYLLEKQRGPRLEVAGSLTCFALLPPLGDGAAAPRDDSWRANPLDTQTWICLPEDSNV